MDVQPTPAEGSGTQVPTCYRHPDRETYLSCVRCGRSACPQCLRSAPVGQQCVECIREGSRGTRRPVTVFGGRAVSGSVITWVLLGLNVIFYLGEWADARLYHYLDMVGAAFDPVIGQRVGVAFGQDYRLITSAFMHEPGLTGFGPAHIIFNMWALMLVGPSLERMLGPVRFLALYLLSALGGAVLFYVLVPPQQTALGASGAIFGLFGAWFVVARRLRADTRSIVFLIGINLVLSFVLARVAWQDHVGGLITGGVLTAAYAYAPRQYRVLVQAGAVVAVAAVLITAVILRNHDIMNSALG